MQLNKELTDKYIKKLQSLGRTVDVELAERIAKQIIEQGHNYDSASLAVDDFAASIWQAGAVE